jgi:predicted O-methyltransferase YrrM
MILNRIFQQALVVIFLFSVSSHPLCLAQTIQTKPDLDNKVAQFLTNARHSWGDLNVPYDDGKLLFDIIVKGKYKRILEIGTSTGHSTIWLAWAVSKTEGTVTTIEIDKGRHMKALDNFKQAGVEGFIDARLGDAHEIVPALTGPFDFVFCDADKEWYLQYFKDLENKIPPRGCFSAHNVLWRGSPDIDRFLSYAKGHPKFRTRIEKTSSEGISVSCRIDAK